MFAVKNVVKFSMLFAFQLAVIFGAHSTYAQETDFSSIEANWRTCASCHGNNGQGKPGFPSLNKLTSEYVVEALNDYRNSVYRGDQSAIMFGMAAALTDEQIELLGKYIEEELESD